MAYIDIKNLTKKFGDFVAVNKVNLEIEKGEILGIIGLSGAGKSTLIRMINKLEIPTSGEVYVNGNNIFDWDELKTRDYRKKTSMIFQHFNILSSKTVFENVALPLEISKKDKKYIKAKVEKLLELVDLLHLKDVYINNLSGGQKQRVAIARALANDPEILLSDESTSSLDPLTSNSILDLLRKINIEFGITIILITHQMEVIKKICNKVAVMKNGEIIEKSTVKELFLNPKTELSKNLIHDLKHDIQVGNKNTLKLIFDGEQANVSFTSQLTRKFNVDVNILEGYIDNLANNTKVGHLIVEIETDDISNIIKWLNDNKVIVEVIKC